MEWMVYVAGDEFDLQELSKSSNSPELCVIKEEDQYYLKSTNFNQINNADEVRNKAEEILSLVNGASRLILETRRPLTPGVVLKINDDGSREGFVSIVESVTMRDIVSIIKISADSTVQEVRRADTIPDWIRLAQKDESVAKVLRLINEFGYNWVNLCRILEIVMKDVGDISKKGWVSNKRLIDRITGTADNPMISGDSARHGIARHEPLPDPITFSEAKALIETILHNWLRSKM